MISDYLLGAAADSYGFDRASCRFITYGREKDKQMYTFDKNKKQYILRIIKNPADSIGQTKAEMDWLLYLAQKGVTVPSPLKTERGELAFRQKKMVKPALSPLLVGWMVCDGTKTIRSCGIKVCFIIGVKLWAICTFLQETILLGMVWRNVMSFPYEV